MTPKISSETKRLYVSLDYLNELSTIYSASIGIAADTLCTIEHEAAEIDIIYCLDYNFLTTYSYPASRKSLHSKMVIDFIEDGNFNFTILPGTISKIVRDVFPIHKSDSCSYDCLKSKNNDYPYRCEKEEKSEQLPDYCFMGGVGIKDMVSASCRSKKEINPIEGHFIYRLNQIFKNQRYISWRSIFGDTIHNYFDDALIRSINANLAGKQDGKMSTYGNYSIAIDLATIINHTNEQVTVLGEKSNSSKKRTLLRLLSTDHRVASFKTDLCNGYFSRKDIKILPSVEKKLSHSFCTVSCYELACSEMLRYLYNDINERISIAKSFLRKTIDIDSQIINLYYDLKDAYQKKRKNDFIPIESESIEILKESVFNDYFAFIKRELSLDVLELRNKFGNENNNQIIWDHSLFQPSLSGLSDRYLNRNEETKVFVANLSEEDDLENVSNMGFRSIYTPSPVASQKDNMLLKWCIVNNDLYNQYASESAVYTKDNGKRMSIEQVPILTIEPIDNCFYCSWKNSNVVDDIIKILDNWLNDFIDPSLTGDIFIQFQGENHKINICEIPINQSLTRSFYSHSELKIFNIKCEAVPSQIVVDTNKFQLSFNTFNNFNSEKMTYFIFKERDMFFKLVEIFKLTNADIEWEYFDNLSEFIENELEEFIQKCYGVEEELVV